MYYIYPAKRIEKNAKSLPRLFQGWAFKTSNKWCLNYRATGVRKSRHIAFYRTLLFFQALLAPKERQLQFRLNVYGLAFFGSLIVYF